MKTTEAEMTMKITDLTAGEFRSEAQTTERVLLRVPQDKLGWKPHPTSLSLGQLALHIATVPGQLADMLEDDEVQVSPDAFRINEPKDAEEILARSNKAPEWRKTSSTHSARRKQRDRSPSKRETRRSFRSRAWPWHG